MVTAQLESTGAFGLAPAGRVAGSPPLALEPRYGAMSESTAREASASFLQSWDTITLLFWSTVQG